jgi:hypothetical protein
MAGAAGSGRVSRPQKECQPTNRISVGTMEPTRRSQTGEPSTEEAAETDASLDQLFDRRGEDKTTEERDEERRDMALARFGVDGVHEPFAHGGLDRVSIPGSPRRWAEREHELLPGRSELARSAVETFEDNALDGRVEALPVERLTCFTRACDRRGDRPRGAVRQFHDEERE